MDRATRFADKVAIVVGAGQTEGHAIGNGRATALLLGRQGARVLAADVNLDSAKETARQIEAEGGEAIAMRVDVTREEDLLLMVGACTARWGRVDILHNNVGVATGDAPVLDIDAARLSQLMSINLEGMILTCKHVLPVMRKQNDGVIINVGSNAVLIDYANIAYKTSKAGVVALTENLAIQNAEFGIRANALLPGLMETPMAIESRVQAGASREEVIAEREGRIPLRGRAGNAWDVAHAAAFLASDEAATITGVALVIDGGQSLRVG